LNDLWRYSDGEWTWMSGNNIVEQSGVYGILGIPSPANTPGARFWPSSWTDASGNLWLFGGFGYDSAGGFGLLNDLWKYSGGQWIWMAGSNMIEQFGTYGSQGVASPDNTPGARAGAAAWTDPSGNLWLYGGSGSDGDHSDLWKYSNGQWTWVEGPDLPMQGPIYGTLGVASPSNNPGSRDSAMAWTDASGAFWLFGGIGADNLNYLLSDLWKYSNGQWTWVSGPSTVGYQGNYGTIGIPATTNLPGARTGGATWVDPSGNLWLFGGAPDNLAPKLNDLWKYQP
jgi:hypothetical protein